MLGRVALPMLLAAVGVEGHGYIREPASRPYLCWFGGPGTNKNCGAAKWSPQSVEGPDRYPESGPPDGTLAGAGDNRWKELNEQSPTRWTKVPVTPGPIDVTWDYEANHVTRDWRYYITKDGWDQSAPLARSTFESTPFCEHSGHMRMPPKTQTHTCTLPSKSGYHVVLAVWDVGDTANTFYNAIDLDFTGGSGSGNGGNGGSGNGGSGNGGSPAVTPTPPAPRCAVEIPLWGNCLNDQNCCVAGARCNVHSQWYAQCVRDTGSQPQPPPSTPTPPATPTPPVPTPRPATPQPATPMPPASQNCPVSLPEGTFCLHAPKCCSQGTSCYQHNMWYGECLRPANNHWGGTLVQ